MINKLFSIYLKLKLVKLVGKYHKAIFCIGGLPDFQIYGKLSISKDAAITFVNNSKHSTLGINRRCKVYVYENASLHFNGKVGMSNAVIVSTKSIIIGNNVMIGGGVTIIDSDFHSLNYKDWFTDADERNMISESITIGNNVFIGMNSIVLKGVHVGNGAVVGAGSVVVSDIPDNEMWAGNPARYIKTLNNFERKK